MWMLYLVTSGRADPTKAPLPVHLAVNGSAEIGDDPAIFIAGDGTEYLAGSVIDDAQGVGVPSLAELIAKIRQHQIPRLCLKGMRDGPWGRRRDLGKVNGAWTTPPEVARLFGEVDRVIHL